MFAHPAVHYARYLALMLDNPAQELNPELELVGMAALTEDQLKDVLHAVATPPQDFSLVDRTHKPSAKWLRKLGVFSILHDEGTRTGISRIVKDRQLRETVERLLIGQVSAREISAKVKELGFQLPEEDVQAYQHYMWDTKTLGIADWANYFREDGKGRTRALRSQYESARVAGPSLAKYRSGIAVTVDRNRALQEVYDECYHSFLEVKSLPISDKKVEMLATCARTLLKVDERIEAGDAALQDVLKRFERFRTLTDPDAVRTMNDIAPHGSFSDKSRQTLLSTKE